MGTRDRRRSMPHDTCGRTGAPCFFSKSPSLEVPKEDLPLHMLGHDVRKLVLDVDLNELQVFPHDPLEFTGQPLPGA